MSHVNIEKNAAQKILSLNRWTVEEWKNPNSSGGRRLFCCWYFYSRQVTLSRIAAGNQRKLAASVAQPSFTALWRRRLQSNCNRKGKSSSIAAGLDCAARRASFALLDACLLGCAKVLNGLRLRRSATTLTRYLLLRAYRFNNRTPNGLCT